MSATGLCRQAVYLHCDPAGNMRSEDALPVLPETDDIEAAATAPSPVFAQFAH